MLQNITLQWSRYKELIWVLTKTDFKLRYQGSFLGYLWAILKPLAIFLILNFVFTSVFARVDQSIPHYSLQLLVAIMMFTFFSEGSTAAMNALRSKSQLITKIYIPRWTLIVSATATSTLTYLTNFLVILAFFAWYRFMPSLEAIAMFLLLSIALYIIILAFGFIVAPLMLRFRDIALIWDVALRVLFYATPIIYPLQMLPAWSHKILLLNPVTFIIHFTKESMFLSHYATISQYVLFGITLTGLFFLSIYVYNKLEPTIAEYI